MTTDIYVIDNKIKLIDQELANLSLKRLEYAAKQIADRDREIKLLIGMNERLRAELDRGKGSDVSADDVKGILK